MKAKKSVQIFISLVLSTIILFLGALYIYDPLQIFHKPWGRKTTFHKNMRQQAAGIINNYDFDSVILGSSMLENTSSDEASKLLGGKFINISISGSNFYERSYILNSLLHKHKIKKVIYSLDNTLENHALEGKASYPLKNFDYLYDNNPFNDINAYLNDKYIKCLRNFSTSYKCIGSKLNLDRPNSWYKVPYHSKRFGGLDKWFKEKNNPQVIKALKRISKHAKNIQNGFSRPAKNINSRVMYSKNYFDQTILKYIQNYPNTEFILILPPYSMIRNAQWAQYSKADFTIYKKMIKYITDKSDIYNNLKIYGWGNHSFVDNIANYKDPEHYEYKINSWMFDAINKNEGLLNSATIDNYLNLFTQRSLSFDLIGLGQKIDDYLQGSD